MEIQDRKPDEDQGKGDEKRCASGFSLIVFSSTKPLIHLVSIFLAISLRSSLALLHNFGRSVWLEIFFSAYRGPQLQKGFFRQVGVLRIEVNDLEIEPSRFSVSGLQIASPAYTGLGWPLFLPGFEPPAEKAATASPNFFWVK
jgi:hypothetical protein